MSEATVVVVKRIRSLLSEESKILEPAKNEIEALLSKIEYLTSYLKHANDNRKLMKTRNKYKVAIDKSIYKERSENQEFFSFHKRLLKRAHECEDVIDHIIYKASHERRQRYSFLKRYSCKPSFQIDPQQIEGIMKRLDWGKLDDIAKSDIIEEPHDLKLKEKSTAQQLRYRDKTQKPPPTTSYPHKLVGLNKDINFLAEKLTRKENQESILYIVGKEGSGKTTLATELSNHPLSKKHFKSVLWTSVSQKRDAKSIFFEILKEAQGKEEDGSRSKSTDELIDKLSNILEQKPYMIIVDDVEDPDNLITDMFYLIQSLNKRSKIVITTCTTPSHPYKHEYVISPDEDVESLANKLTTRLPWEGEQPSLFSVRDLDNSGRNTDLARDLYDHQSVQQHFEQRIWITTSKEWGTAAMLLEIIGRISIDKTSIQDFSKKKLAELIIGALEKKRYLLVIDDMGDAEDLVFHLTAARSNIRTHKRNDAFDSQIIITAGNPRIFYHSNLRCILYEMRPLTEEESWTLICSIVLNQAKSRPEVDEVIDQFNKNPHREMVKRITMLKNCNGIPLAIVALGGLLSTKKTVEEWETVSTSLGSEEMQSNQALDNILLFCYRDLPSDIIPCFLYFSFFPKDSTIPTGMLIRMWLAEGLVTLDPPSGTQISEINLENVAAMYLEELASRYLIQVMRRNHIGEMKNVGLHDKIHQLSVTKSAELGLDTPLQATYSRRAIIHAGNDYSRRTIIHPGEFDAYPMSSELRTLVQFGKQGLSTKHYYFQHEALLLKLEPIHENFKLLRVLILCGVRTCKTLPEQIGDLIFLTYLGLRATSVQALPKTIQNLRRLMTLDYRGSLNPSFGGICEPLPDVLLQMTKLRHVYLPEKAIPSMKKLNLSTLQNLQILWGVSGGDWLTTDLAKLSAPLVKLGIVNISCSEELEAVVRWLNTGPKQLQVLKLDWLRARQVKLLLPYDLCSLQHIWKLTLVGRLKEEYNFKVLPSLVKLELFFSHLKSYDPTEMLGHLPNLKNLLLWNSYEGIQWICGANMFPKLEELQISHLPNLEEWRVAEGAMPGLKKLSIYSCWKLLGLPKGLKYLNLQELEILNMPRSFCSRLQEIENENAAVGEDVDIIRNIRYIKFEAC